MPRTATRVDLDALLGELAQPPSTDDLHERVLRTSASVLLGTGLDGFEVDVVAERSGVGRSTIYRRFGDRNGLLSATLAHEARRFLGALAVTVASIDDLEEQVVAAFSAGLRLVRSSDLADLLRSEPLLLRVLTVDSGPLVTVACDQLVAEGLRRRPALDAARTRRTAEVLVRLALSFVVQPETALDLADDAVEQTVRHHVAPLVRDG